MWSPQTPTTVIHGVGAGAHPLAERIAVRPVAAGQRLADDDDRLRVFAIGVGEGAPGANRDLQRLEESRRRRAVVDGRRVRWIGVGDALDLDRPAGVVVRGGHDVDGGGAVDPGNITKPLDSSLGERTSTVGDEVLYGWRSFEVYPLQVRPLAPPPCRCR